MPLDPAEFPKMRKNRIDATSFLDFPDDYPEYLRDRVEECARSWTYRFRGSSGIDEVCCLPFGQNRSSHRIPSTKTKQHDRHMNKTAIGIKMEIALYQ